MAETLVDMRKEPFYSDILEACRASLDLVRRGSWMIVKGYWQIGHIILRYEKEGMLTFEKGARTMEVLAQDLGFRDPTLLYRMREAATRYPTEELLEQARKDLVSIGRDPHWTNFRNLCLPRDTEHPERYGGAENVFDSKVNHIETLLIEMEEVEQMAKDEEQREQWDGVKVKAREVFADVLEVQALPFGKNQQVRSEDYLDYVRSLPCCIGDEPPPSDPHHVQRAGLGGISLKPSDFFAIPMCRSHHDMFHANREETEKWLGVDLWYEVAKCLQKYLKREIGT